VTLEPNIASNQQLDVLGEHAESRRQERKTDQERRCIVSRFSDR
jgi:hypothetical protein